MNVQLYIYPVQPLNVSKMKTQSEFYTALIQAKEAVKKIHGVLHVSDDLVGTSESFDVSYCDRRLAFPRHNPTLSAYLPILGGDYTEAVDFLNAVRIHAEAKLQNEAK